MIETSNKMIILTFHCRVLKKFDAHSSLHQIRKYAFYLPEEKFHKTYKNQVKCTQFSGSNYGSYKKGLKNENP